MEMSAIAQGMGYNLISRTTEFGGPYMDLGLGGYLGHLKLVAIRDNQEIHVLNGEESIHLIQIPGGLNRADINGAGILFGRNAENLLWRTDIETQVWEQFEEGLALDAAIAEDGTLLMIDMDRNLNMWDEENKHWVPVDHSGIENLDRVSIWNRDDFMITTTEGKLCRYAGEWTCMHEEVNCKDIQVDYKGDWICLGENEIIISDGNGEHREGRQNLRAVAGFKDHLFTIDVDGLFKRDVVNYFLDVNMGCPLESFLEVENIEAGENECSEGDQNPIYLHYENYQNDPYTGAQYVFFKVDELANKLVSVTDDEHLAFWYPRRGDLGTFFDDYADINKFLFKAEYVDDQNWCLRYEFEGRHFYLYNDRYYGIGLLESNFCPTYAWWRLAC